MSTLQQFEVWPDRLRSADILFRIKPLVSFGPIMRDGDQQVVASGGGHWVATMNFDVNLGDEVREFFAVSAKGAGGVTEWFVPARQGRLVAPWPDGTDYTTTLSQVTFADGRTLADGRAFVRKVIDIELASAASAGAVSINVRKIRAGTLRRGQFFTIADASGRQRLHVVTDVPRFVSTNVWNLKVAPPLRSAAPAKAKMDWDDPSCTMVFADPDTAQLTLRPWFQGTAQVDFRESKNGL